MPIDREKILQSAQKYVDKKRYDRAIAEYQRIVHEDPNDARTLLKIGDLQARLQAYPEAIATYDRVGQFYAAQGFSLKAIAVYKQIRELINKHAPDLADRYGHIVPKLAEIYIQLGLTSDALAAYDEVAIRMQRSGRDREAIDVFRKMVSLDSGNPLPHLRLAEACCRVQSLDEAIESFWTAAELLLNLARRDDALKVIERILHFRQDTRFSRFAAELYLQRGSREDGLQALTKLQIAFQADPKNLETLGLLAQAFTLIGQANKAIEVYKEMARLAREQDRPDLFAELIAHLKHVAPHDEQVRALEHLPARSEAPRSLAPPSSNSISVVPDAEVEFLEEEDDDEPRFMPSNAPIALHKPRPLAASAPDVVVVDNEQEAAEELLDQGSFDARAHARKAIVDAESFRRLRLYPKAIEALHIALEIDARSLHIRQKLRELLLESGDREGAAQEGINVATLYLERGEVAEAETALREVLELDPSHPDALAMLDELALGADVGHDTEVQAHPHAEQLAQPHDIYDPDAPLPSYDLEEVSAEQAMYSEPGRPLRSLGSEPPLTTDEPFTDDAPLPSFPLGSEADEYAEGYTEEDAVEISNVDDYVPPGEAAQQAVEEVLDEADFFAARGLYEDAKAILVEQLSRTPNHPLVLERIREVAAAMGSLGSQTIERSQIGAQQSEAPADYDIENALGALGDREDGRVSTTTEVPELADQVFASFKAGIRASVSDESDSATRYDLGVAYKEMGLIAEAINEFEIAARDPNRECMCFAMIGLIYLEQSKLDRASEAYIRALSASTKTVEQEMSLYYDLGNVYEMKGKNQDALYYFQKIARRDPGYRDVSDRIVQLKPDADIQPQHHIPQRQVAVNDQDEFDAVFDDLFNKG